MAVEAFLPPSESKITIEKPVKEKPKLSELTKIEKPGKNIKDIELDKPKKPVRKKPVKPKSATTKISDPKRDSVLIITEKPQAAMKIASALGSPKKYVENKVSFYELEKDGKKIVVASAVGHLFNLTYQAGQKGWPVFKTEWVPSYEQKSAAFTRNYFNVLKKLARKAKEVIVATDYDIEGEVIGWNVLRFIAEKEDAKRMKYSTLTKNELIKSYENPLPTLDWGQAYAGESRHLVDWLYGINLSRALMSSIKKAGSFRILSIGRVQGPALKIIVERDKEIESFKSQPYWQVFAHANGVEFKHPKDIFDKSELSAFEKLKEGEAKTENKEENLSPPHPFDLTTLQREAYKFHKISPSNTLKTAQALYLDGVISYPRTSSQKIPKEIEPKKILKELAKNFPAVKFATRENPVEGKKSDPAHPSIYPTGEFKKLPDDSYEKKIYELIVKRFIACFSPDALTTNKKITLQAEDKKFTASALTVLNKGWTNVYPAKLEEGTLPDMNGKYNLDKINFEEKETQPPNRYTAASLISTLEKKNLGTKATRSSIVDTLFDRGYLDGKSIKATPLGVKLIEALERYSPIIIDENLTRELEEKMEDIQNSKSDFQKKEKQIIESVEKLLTDISKEFKTHETEIGKSLMHGNMELREQQKNDSILMKCNVCGEGSLKIMYSKKTRKQFVACDKYPECKNAHSLPPNALIKKTEKVSERGLPVLMAIRKGKRPWEFEFNPNWRAERDSQENSQN